MREIKKHSFYLKGKKLFEEIFANNQVEKDNDNNKKIIFIEMKIKKKK